MAGAETAGIIAGLDPLVYNSSQPFILFIFQAIFMITLSQIIYIPLSWIKQPRVIAEVITGIILGPTVMGHIPGFTAKVFPTEGTPGLSLMANIGVIFLLFMVGCEVDIEFIKKNFKTAVSVGVVNMAVPFGLGCAISVGFWNEYRAHDDDLPKIEFTTFMVFIATAMCITAFPVLARILTALRLVKDRVGVIVLAAGITNDLMGWMLLALSITLANSTKSEVTAYICLATIGWCLFILYPVRWLLRWVLIDVLHDVESPNGPSQLANMIIILTTLVSSFFTGIIGVHCIFGAVVVGMIIPRENNYVIRVTEKLEDFVNIFMVPLYFALAGLSVNLGLLNHGIDWGYIVGIIAIAMIGKIAGGAFTSKLLGLYWRESFAVGVLMSCKGIVEIVVLQTGLKASIISQKTFSMFIVMALVSTFLTTPLTLLTYPQSYRDRRNKWLKEREDKEFEQQMADSGSDSNVLVPYRRLEFGKLVLPVDDLESVSNNLLLLNHISIPTVLPIHAVNVKTLTDRTADILHASMIKDDKVDSHDALNSILSILKIFADLNSLPFSSEILYALPDTYVKTLYLSSNFSRQDLLILTLNNRDFYDKPQTLREVRESSQQVTFYSGVFINNNQEITKSELADEDDSASLASNETILNPNSFHISTITLFLTNESLTQEDLVALRVFSTMIDHKSVKAATILVSDSNHILEIITKETDLVNRKNVNLNIHKSGIISPKISKKTKKPISPDADVAELQVQTTSSSDNNSGVVNTKISFEEFFDMHYTSSHSNINDLIIISDNKNENSTTAGFVKRMVDHNDKVLVIL